jgi:hypothetical protein
MATPSYKGNGQPQADNSFLSGFGSWLGGDTPAYKPAPTSGAAAVARTIDASNVPPGTIVILVPRDLVAQPDVIEPQQ